jgi:hypothetical protein
MARRIKPARPASHHLATPAASRASRCAVLRTLDPASTKFRTCNRAVTFGVTHPALHFARMKRLQALEVTARRAQANPTPHRLSASQTPLAGFNTTANITSRLSASQRVSDRSQRLPPMQVNKSAHLALIMPFQNLSAPKPTPPHRCPFRPNRPTAPGA